MTHEIHKLVIGTRGSALALHQTHHIADLLRAAHPNLEIVIETIQTRGDATQAANVPLSSFGEKGIFAKELEEALLLGTIDLAVHSMKDLAHTLPIGLSLAAVPSREDPRDALIGSTLEMLPFGARVGTGSVRRRALLLSRRPDLVLLEIRGNIDTRLRKLQTGNYDAICLAVAGLNRLNLQNNIAEILSPDWFTPDPCQGALGLETRSDDTRVRELLQAVSDLNGEVTTRTERAFLQQIGGSCKTPVGALATFSGSQVSLQVMVASPDGTTILRDDVAGDATHPEELGQQAAQRLIDQGAAKIF